MYSTHSLSTVLRYTPTRSNARSIIVSRGPRPYQLMFSSPRALVEPHREIVARKRRLLRPIFERESRVGLVHDGRSLLQPELVPSDLVPDLRPARRPLQFETYVQPVLRFASHRRQRDGELLF